MDRFIFCFSIIAAAFISSCIASTNNCSKEDAIQAEKSSSTLNDWQAVYDAFREYKKCDDGAIWEGYSESVGRLLANNWEKLSELNNLILKDKKFEVFVLRHLDQTMPREYSDKILDNTKYHCLENKRGR